MSRMLGAVPVLADSIVEQLCKASDRASDAHQQLGGRTEEETAALSTAVWHSIWPVERCVAPVHGAVLGGLCVGSCLDGMSVLCAGLHSKAAPHLSKMPVHAC